MTENKEPHGHMEPEMPEYMEAQMVHLYCRDCWHWQYDELKEDENNWNEQVGVCHRYPSDTATIPKQNPMTGEVSLEVIALNRPARWDHYCGEHTRRAEWPGWVPPPGGYVEWEDEEEDKHS